MIPHNSLFRILFASTVVLSGSDAVTANQREQGRVSLGGKVVTANGKPVDAALVILVDVTENPVPGVLPQADLLTARRTIRLRTAADGRFSTRVEPDRQYSVVARWEAADGNSYFETQRAKVFPGERAVMRGRAKLPRPSVMVTKALREAAGDAMRVQIHYCNRWEDLDVTKDSVALPLRYGGTGWLRVVDGSGKELASASYWAHAIPHPPVFRLDVGGRAAFASGEQYEFRDIRLTIQDDDGKAIDGVRVYAFPRKRPGEPELGRADADGVATLALRAQVAKSYDGSRTGNVTVLLSAPDLVEKVVHLHVHRKKDGSQTCRPESVRLDTGVPLAGTLRHRGAALQDATVVLETWHDELPRRSVRVAKTDADGKFDFGLQARAAFRLGLLLDRQVRARLKSRPLRYPSYPIAILASGSDPSEQNGRVYRTDLLTPLLLHLDHEGGHAVAHPQVTSTTLDEPPQRIRLQTTREHRASIYYMPGLSVSLVGSSRFGTRRRKIAVPEGADAVPVVLSVEAPRLVRGKLALGKEELLAATTLQVARHNFGSMMTIPVRKDGTFEVAVCGDGPFRVEGLPRLKSGLGVFRAVFEPAKVKEIVVPLERKL